MDELLGKSEVALRKGKKALKAKQFTIAFIYLEAARLIGELVRESSPYQDMTNKADRLLKECRETTSEYRESLLVHEARVLLQLCFYNYLFVWANANNQIPTRRMIIFDKRGYWLPDPNRSGEHVFIGETREDAMHSLEALYEQLPARYRSLPLNPFE